MKILETTRLILRELTIDDKYELSKILSDKELLELRPMRLNSNIFAIELKTFGFNLKSPDCNLNNYIIITQGKYSGTILYNGPFKFIDNTNKRYFGIDLSV